MKLFLVIILVVLLQQINALQKAEAILTTKIYSSIKYHDIYLQYERAGFELHFGEYIVSYRDKDGKLLSFMLKPRYFPFIVSYGPLDEMR